MANEDFCLKWNDHHSVFFNSVEKLCDNGCLTDVSLSCGSRIFSAHKLVLSVCSTYFANLFAGELCKNRVAIVYLKDVNPRHMELLLNYMYRGEINVQEHELVQLLATAKGLQIKGLTEDDTSTVSDTPTPNIEDIGMDQNSEQNRSLRQIAIASNSCGDKGSITKGLSKSSSRAYKHSREPLLNNVTDTQKRIKEEFNVGWHDSKVDTSLVGSGPSNILLEHNKQSVDFKSNEAGNSTENDDEFGDFNAEGIDEVSEFPPIPEGGGPMIFEDEQPDVGTYGMPNAKRRSRRSNGTRGHIQRRVINLDMKLKIIKGYEAGKKVSEIAHELELAHSTVSTILKDKQRVLESAKVMPGYNAVIMGQQSGGGLIQEMEKLLASWFEDQIQNNLPLSFLIVQDKARSIFLALQGRIGEEYPEPFTPDQAWFLQFRRRFNLPNPNSFAKFTFDFIE